MANLFQQYMRPPKSVAEYGAEYDAADNNKLALVAKRMQMEQAQRGMADDQAVRNAYRTSGGDGAKFRNALTEIGNYKGVQAFDAAELARQKGQADIGKTEAETKERQFKIIEQKINLAGQVFGFVNDNPSVESATMAVQGLQEKGIWNEEQAAKAMSEIQANPTPDGIRMLATRAFKSALAAKDQLPQYFAQNRGGSAAVVGVNAVTGAANDVQSAPITQSADNAASQAQSNINNQRSVGASLQNAAATRDMARAQQDQTRAWQDQTRMLQLDKLQSDKEVRDRGKQAAVDSVKVQMSVIDKALDHPGRETATGVSGVIDPRNYVPGTDSANFQAVLSQINGTAFLQAFETLKGGGQITEVEGKKATEAIARLNRSQSDDEFKQSLLDLRSVMEKGYERLTGQPAPKRADKPKSGEAKKIANDADYNALPSGALFIGPDGKQRRKP